MKGLYIIVLISISPRIISSVSMILVNTSFDWRYTTACIYITVFNYIIVALN